MSKTKQTSERVPPLPKDKPASYDSYQKNGPDKNVAIREDKSKTPTKAMASPQKTREKLEVDTSKRERDPGMTKK